VRNEYYNKSWDAFNQAVEELRPKSKEDLPENAAFWWLLPDIIVRVKVSVISPLLTPF
jgi:xylulokinase